MILLPKKNIRLINTDLSGKPVDDILADFVFNETGTKVVRCLQDMSQNPGYTGDKSQQFHVFKRNSKLSTQAQCKAKIYKRKPAEVTVLVKSHERAKQQRFMERKNFDLLKSETE